MKFRARLQGDTGEVIPVEVAAASPDFRVTVGDRLLLGEAASLRPGIWSLVFDDGRQQEVSLEGGPDGLTRARFGNALAAFEFQDELTALASAAGGKSKSRKGDVVLAAMPGRVLRLSVEIGAIVSAGQGLLVLEAMKMENEVKAPRDGVVESIGVAAGQAVSAGEVLIRLKAES